MGNLVFSLGTVEQEPPPAQDGAARYWTQLGGITYFSPINPLINQVLAAWPAQADNVFTYIGGDDAFDPTTRMPVTMPAGGLSFTLVRDGDFGADHPMVNKQYVIRHNLPGTYTVTVTGRWTNLSAYSTVNGLQRATFDFGLAGSQLCSVMVTGPAGTMPVGWFVEVLRVSDEAAYDNAALPAHHATRVFIPEYLSLFDDKQPGCMRFVKAIDAEYGMYVRELADAPSVSMKQWHPAFPPYFKGSRQTPVRLPLEVCVSLCNFLNCDLYWNMWSASSDALIDYCAAYIRDNLNDGLKCYIELANEVWNSVYNVSNAVFWAEGIKRYGIQGTGTVSITKNSRTVTFNGFDPSTLYPTLTQPMIVIGDYTYTLDKNTVTSTTATMRDLSTLLRGAKETLTDVPWYYVTGGNLLGREGFVIHATRCAKRFHDVFSATGKRGRLLNVAPSQAANDFVTRVLLYPTQWPADGDYINPLDYFDVVAITSYFGAQYPQSKAETAALIEGYLAEEPPNTAAINALFDLSIPAILEWLRPLPDTHREVMPEGMPIVAYEGGSHVVDGTWATQGVADAWLAWLKTPGAQEVFEAWVDTHVTKFDCPPMQFNFMDDVGPFGVWGLYNNFNYDITGDNRIGELVAFNARGHLPWWVPENPPVGARAVPDQTWTTGVNPAFDLSEWASRNATSFAGTPPAGCTLNTSTGLITGTPTTAVAADYTFTASNAAGTSGNIVINITVA